MPITTTSSASSGVLQSLGLGSGLDISTLVTQLTTAEMSAATTRISRQQSAVTTELSALSALKSALSNFKSSLSALSGSSGVGARSVSISDDDALAVLANSSAAVGSYDVTVKQLAKAHQLLSTSFGGGAATVVGTGTLTLGVGGSSFNVNIDSNNNTLAGIRNAINAASDNTGVSATIVYGTGTAQLLLTGARTGADNLLTVNTTGGDGGLSALVYNATTTTNYTVRQAPQDSIVSVAGVDHHNSANVVGDAIDGMTLTLKQADINTPITVSIGNDADHVVSVVQGMVTAYNTLNKTLTALGSYDSQTKASGPMFGDALLNGVKTQLRNSLSSAVASATGNYRTMINLGLKSDASGNYTLDSSKLSAALSADYSGVTSMLSGSDGVITRLSSLLDVSLSSAGGIDARNTGLTKRQTSINQENGLLQVRSAKVQERYLAKFNAMDTLLSKLQNTSTYLTQQFEALNKSLK
jgi:flagellar hook-associated protein 2